MKLPKSTRPIVQVVGQANAAYGGVGLPVDLFGQD